MPVGILFFKENNVIHDFFENVTEIKPGRIDYVGGYVEGFNEDEVGVLVVEGLAIKTKEIPNERVIELENGKTETIKLPSTYEKWLEDEQGNIFKIGDKIPTGLIDLKHKFIKPTPLDQEQRLADIELMLAELIKL